MERRSSVVRSKPKARSRSWRSQRSGCVLGQERHSQRSSHGSNHRSRSDFIH